MSLLTITGLSSSIGNTRVCVNLDLQLHPGQCWGILGVNGIGKTTLLHILAGLRPPDAGKVCYDGRDLAKMPAIDRARKIGILFQQQSLTFASTLLEAVLAGRHPHLGPWGWESDEDIALARAALDQVGLLARAEQRIDTLSGGEWQRMAIATVLTQDPRIALLDEPSNHLDLGQQINMLTLLKHRFATPRRALMMVLHDINLALRFCDHLLLLQGGGQWLAGPTTRTATTENLSSLFGHPLESLRGPAGLVMLPR